VLFNSYVFLFVYLPAVLVIYQGISRFGRKAVVIWLIIASLGFYTYWKPQFVLVLGASILWNFGFSLLISRRVSSSLNTRSLLWIAIVGNLGALCWYKYLFPSLNFLARHTHSSHVFRDVALPLGISFFTFTQIGYLVDLQQGAADPQQFTDYLLFVTFFPHLIAGPILHHKDIMPQFKKERNYSLNWDDVAVGASWFTMGLIKKVSIADNMALWINPIFNSYQAAGTAAAWAAALGYTLQLYFDFSGYSDMACGLARIFSIDFPLNFASPYKARSIIDFWQRWHMTLTQYIGAYLYSPTQFWIVEHRLKKGKKTSRKAQATIEGFAQMVAFPTIITMVIAGIWHGAGLTFVAFGLLHGLYLAVNHGWRIFRHSRKITPFEGLAARVAGYISVLSTFACVMIADVFFRSDSITQGVGIISRMAGYPKAHIQTVLFGQHEAAWLFIGFAIAWGLPNTQQILARFKPALALAPSDQATHAPVHWRPNLTWATVLAIGFIAALAGMQTPSSFLYFQF
jgi:alginate O-acetyltransferase complex protein AlgI